MAHPLEQKLVELRRRARPLTVLRGVFMAATVLLGAIAAAGLFDYVFRLQDRGLRIIASLTVLAVAGWAIYRHVVRSLQLQLGEVELARRVQRQFPILDDQLVTAVEFLHTADDDPAAGSVALRRTVVAKAMADAEDLDFLETLDRRPVVRAGAIAALTYAAVILLLVVPNLAATQSALKRLLNPFGNTPWPQATNLALRQPVERIARGKDFAIEVIDARGARLPRDVRIHYRLPTPDGGTVEETERMSIVGNVATAKRENVSRPFSFRVDGGDDPSSIPWTPVDVVDPPAIASLSIRLTPPLYTGKPATLSERLITATIGTQLQITGKATKPLASADFCFDGSQTTPAKIGQDGCTLTVSGVVKKSGVYWFTLTDREGFRGGSDDRWEIRAIPDASPTVQIEQPRADMFVTPQAVAPIRILAKDDLAICDVALAFRRAESEPETTLPLYSGPKQPPQQPETSPPGDSRVIDYRWSLAPLGLQPGAQLTFYAVAGDYKPQTARSEPRRLIVVTPDDLRDRLADRERLIVAELERALKMQRACREQVESARIRLGDLRQFSQTDVDRLQAAEHAQREVNDLLSRRGEGIPARIAALLADLENNGIDNADARQRMNGLLEELDRLDKEVIPPLGRNLTAAMKTAQVNQEGQGIAAAIAGVRKSLVAAADRQDEIIAALDRQIRQLGRWDSYRRLHRDLAQLLRDQEEAAHRTTEIGRRTLTQDLRDLAPQDLADLHAAAARQLELARLLDRVLQEAEQGNAELRKSDPLAADFVADTLDEARRLAISGQMREAGVAVQQNQIGQAAAAQKQIATNLQAILDILANHREKELGGLVKKLRALQSNLAAIESQQEDLHGQIETAGNEKNKESADRQLQQLGGDQQRLREETERLARQLARLQAEQAAEAAAQAAKQMSEAGQRAGEGSAADAAKKAADARRSLADARRQLADQLQKSAAELAQEQLIRLGDNVKHLRRQQQNALDEAKRLRGLEESQGQLSRSQAFSVHELARLQRSLQTDAAGLGRQLAAAAAFELALTGAADDMARAAASLEQRQTGPSTQAPQRRALGRLDQLVEALKPEPPLEKKDNEANQPAGGNNGNKKQGPQGDSLPPVAQLKLLKLMQQEINSRIEALQQAAGVKPTPEQLREYKALSKQQGQLADIVLQFVTPAERNAEPQPDAEVKPTYVSPVGGVSRRRSDVAYLSPSASGDASYNMSKGDANNVDEDQLKRELGAAAEKESDNPMLQIARDMTEAKQRIAKADSGPGTQQLQREIVDRLDRLIQQARQKAGQCKPGQCQSKPSDRQQPPKQPPKPVNKPGKNPNSKSAAPGTPRSPDKNAGKKSAAAAEAHDAMQRLWYLLPQHAREQMQQSPGEEFPPKYETQIEDYFRRLSQEKKKP